MNTSPLPHNDDDPIAAVVELVGLTRLASELGVTPQAIRKWQKAGRLPRTEWTGETEYAIAMERLTCGAVNQVQLKRIWGKRSSAPETPRQETQHAA